MVKPSKPEICATCKRDKKLTFHHLVPKRMHRQRKTQERFQEIDLIHHGIWVCEDCHKKIHRLFSLVELAQDFHTLPSLTSNVEFAKFLSWVRKQRKNVK